METVLQDLLTIEEIATRFNVTRELMRRIVRSGELRSVRVGRSYRISLPDLQAYWREHGGGTLTADTSTSHLSDNQEVLPTQS